MREFRRCGRRFSESWSPGWGLCRQAVRIVVQPVSMSRFQGQSRGSRSRLRRPVRMMRPAATAEMEAALFCAMAKAPEERFQTAGQFAKALAGEGPLPARKGAPPTKSDGKGITQALTSFWKRLGG